MALQGVDGALPLIHGAQGCSFLQKVLLTKHFREPIALQSTKLFTEEVVMGSEEKFLSAAKEIISKQNPSLLAVLTSGLSEIKGDDLERVIHSVSPAHNLILVNTPDYSGGLEDGYRMAVEAIIKGLLPPGAINGERGPNKAKGQINILAGSHLTPADFGELREIARSFGLETIILPDLSSLDGSRHGLTALAAGGTTVEQIRQMASSEFTIAIGESLEAAAVLIKARAGIDYKVLPAPFGLEGSDELFAAFSNLSGNPVPERYQRERLRLLPLSPNSPRAARHLRG